MRRGRSARPLAVASFSLTAEGTMRKTVVPIFVALGLLLLVAAAPALASARTFYVPPTFKDDTANIQTALDKASTCPGSTVQLGPYHYYTNRILVHNFKGTFKGAGEGRNGTVIDCLRGLDPSLPGVIVKAEPDINPFPFLVGFDGGNVRVSDLSFDITAASPVDPQANGGSDVIQAIVLVTGNASSAFERVAITAGPGSDQGYNADEDIVIIGYAPGDADGNWLSLPLISGNESICDCSLIGHDGVQVDGLTHGSLMVSGSVLDDLAIPCLIGDVSASQVTITGNQMHCSKAGNVVFWQGFAAFEGAGAPLPSLPAPRCLISGNHMLATGYADAVLLEDDSPSYGAPHRLDATVSGNTIVLDNGGESGGIEGFWVKGAQVLGNRISGTGLAGIDMGIISAFGGPSFHRSDSGWRIIGNDVSGVNASTAYGGPGAQIWLGPDASNCLVVGGKAPTQVLDQGSNDTLINVTPVFAPLAARSMQANTISRAGLASRLHKIVRR